MPMIGDMKIAPPIANNRISLPIVLSPDWVNQKQATRSKKATLRWPNDCGLLTQQQ